MALGQAQPRATHLHIMFIAPGFLVVVEEEARRHRALRLALEAARSMGEARSQIDAEDHLASVVQKASTRRMNLSSSP